MQGRKDIAKLQKKTIINRKGITQTVYVGDNSKPVEKKKLPVKINKTETSEFKGWFGNSKVVNEKGKPLVVYRGDFRADKVGSTPKVSKATSGRFYFTSNPELASKYATGKVYRDEDKQDYENWFTFPQFKQAGERNAPNLRQVWYRLSPEQKQKLSEVLPSAGHSDETGELTFGENSFAGDDQWQREVRRAGGNWLEAAKEIILMSGSIFNEERQFVTILKQAGLNADYDNPNDERSGVMPVYLRIENPVDTSNIPLMKKLHSELSAQFKSDRSRAKAEDAGADMWDKTIRTPKQWLQLLANDIEEGNTHAWTSVPEKITKALQAKGFDGVKDTGGKMGGDKHDVWIAFEPNQIKSYFNKGKFSRESDNILKSIAGGIANLLMKAVGHDYGHGRHQEIVQVHTQHGVHQRKQWVGTEAEPQRPVQTEAEIKQANQDDLERIRTIVRSVENIEDVISQDRYNKFKSQIEDAKNLAQKIKERNKDLVEESDRVRVTSVMIALDNLYRKVENNWAMSQNVGDTGRTTQDVLDDLSARKSELKSINSGLKNMSEDYISAEHIDINERDLKYMEKMAKEYIALRDKLPVEIANANDHKLKIEDVNNVVAFFQNRIHFLKVQRNIKMNDFSEDDKALYLEKIAERQSEVMEYYRNLKDNFNQYGVDNDTRTDYKNIEAEMDKLTRLKMLWPSGVSIPNEFSDIDEEEVGSFMYEVKEEIDKADEKQARADEERDSQRDYDLGDEENYDDEESNQRSDADIGSDDISPEERRERDTRYAIWARDNMLKDDLEQYKYRVYVGGDKQVLKRHNVTGEELARMFGAPPHSEIQITCINNTDDEMDENGESHDIIKVGIVNEDFGLDMKRKISFADNTIHNEYFKIDKDMARYTGPGVGARISLDQIKGIEKFNNSAVNPIYRIVVDIAAKDRGTYNGFYTWVRYGYDKQIADTSNDKDRERFEATVRNWQSNLQSEYGISGADVDALLAKKPLYYSDLMKDNRWRNWWKDAGYQLDGIYMNTKAFKEAGGETETTSQAIKFLTDYADTHLKTVGLKNNSGETLKSLSDMLIKKGSSFGEEISELDEAALNESAARTGMYEHKPSEG